MPASAAATITRSVPHGHVAAVHAQARALGLPGLLGPPGRDGDLALALIISRVVKPASKLATTPWWDDTTLGADLGVAEASTDQVYAGMDWLLARQDAPGSRRRPGAGRSAWVEGSHCPLAQRGYSRDAGWPRWPPTTGRCSCPCSTRSTWPRSPTPTTPGNG